MGAAESQSARPNARAVAELSSPTAGDEGVSGRSGPPPQCAPAACASSEQLNQLLQLGRTQAKQIREIRSEQRALKEQVDASVRLLRADMDGVRDLLQGVVVVQRQALAMQGQLAQAAQAAEEAEAGQLRAEIADAEEIERAAPQGDSQPDATCDEDDAVAGDDERTTTRSTEAADAVSGEEPTQRASEGHRASPAQAASLGQSVACHVAVAPPAPPPQTAAARTSGRRAASPDFSQWRAGRSSARGTAGCERGRRRRRLRRRGESD